MSDSCILPRFEANQAAQIAARLYGLEGPLKALHGERDLNFLISDSRGQFVFKIANAEESPEMLDCQHRVFERLAKQRVFTEVAIACPSLNGLEIETVSDAQGQLHYCRVLPFLQGHIWSGFKISSPQLLHRLGASLANLDLALQGFKHPGLERALLWDMEITGARLDDYKPLIKDKQDLHLVEHFESAYLQQVVPRQQAFRRGVIHNDANRENVLVNADASEIISVIDFGDMLDSWLVLEPAIAATYAMHDQPDPLASAAALVAGYHSKMALTELELDVLFDLIGMRLCMSLCLFAYQQRLQPDNSYLSIDQQQTRSLLQQLYPINRSEAQEYLRAACTQESD